MTSDDEVRPDGAAAPEAPAYEYPASGSGFYTAALEALEAADATAAPTDGGDLSELFEMLDDDVALEPEGVPAPITVAPAAPPPPPPIAVAPAAPPPPPADAYPPTPPVSAVAPPPPPPAMPTFAPPPAMPVYEPPPAMPAYAPPPDAPTPDAATEPVAAEPERAAPVPPPAADAHCAMCGMTVPIDYARGRCHLGHVLAANDPGSRKGRRG